MKTEYINSQNRQISRVFETSHSVRVRSFDARHSEDVCHAKEIAGGLYFETSLGHYYEGMNVLLARNVQAADPQHREEIAKIVRAEKRCDGKFGIAIRIL